MVKFDSIEYWRSKEQIVRLKQIIAEDDKRSQRNQAIFLAFCVIGLTVAAYGYATGAISFLDSQYIGSIRAKY